ncbi:ATP-binding cassette sub-family C member 4-like [Gigantopelta aegis]|uniref:ATP-binding cassette sub-family C member 4-like n=1 Tax=Gigantopelta aegis TaxID=1735272 RepID=UPI001B8884C7|nr:ATP-binding cassette sub-family C member 4-like [Gigantopelta aegis]
MKEEGKPCPYDKANWLSRISFWWLTPLFISGFKRPLTSSDIYDVSREDKSAQLEKILERTWKQELRRYSDGQSTSLLRAILWAFRLQWLFPAILLFISESSKVLAPYLVGQLVGFFIPGSKVTTTTAYIYAVSLGLVGLTQMCNPLYFFIMQRTALKMKTAVGSLIYRKVLSLSSQSFYQTTSGQIVNLLSTDVEKFHPAVENIHYLWLSPLVMITCIYLIYQQCGLASLFGFSVIVIFMPLQMINAKLFGHLRSKIGQCSDQRVHMMTEIISGIKVIKMYCWEQPFSSLINSLRGQVTTF